MPMPRLERVLPAGRGILLCLAAFASAATGKEPGKSPKTSYEGSVNLTLALSYLETGLHDRAFERASRAVASDPKSAEAHAVLGMVQARRGRQDEAGGAFAKAAKLAPGDGRIHNAYGAWLCERGAIDEGRRLLALALENPGRAPRRDVLYNAAECAYRDKRPEDAERWLRELLAGQPLNAPALLLMSRLMLGTRRSLEARAFLQRREALGPLPEEALRHAIDVEIAAGDSRAASRYRDELNQRFPPPTPTGEGAGRP